MGRRLNISTPTVIQTELVPLDENFVIEANGTLEQWYYDNTAQFAPDRSITPLILTPKISVADKDLHQSWDNEHVVKSVVVWSVMEGNTWVDVTSSSATQNYVLSGNNLIVHKNVSYSQGVTIRCRLTYQDPRDNGIYITTQETVLLTCNRDSNVILPQVAITNPSARSFNPLVDTQTQFDFDAIISNSPDVERQSSDIATYAVDGSGTEEIIGDTNSVVPILDIRYPDGETQTNQEFMYRRTANGEKTDEVGSAFISKIKGNTVAWNQSAFDISRFYLQIASVGTVTYENGYLRVVFSSKASSWQAGVRQDDIPVIKGHKYYHCYSIFPSKDCRISSDIWGVEAGGENIIANTWSKFSIITTCPENRNITSLLNRVYSFEAGDYYLYKDAQLIDLTFIYGSGNEPTTPEQFEADYLGWFGKPLSYEPYDAGSLIPVRMNGIKTIGFNQWDEEWELGNINGNTGANQYSSDRIRSKNYIKVICGANYYFRGPINTNIRIVYYDESKNVISAIDSNDSEFTTPNNAFYIRFVYGSGAAPYTSYNHDICVNISNQSKNGTYESYEEHLASVPVTSAKGRLLDSNGNAVGNSAFVFPDGLKKAGDVYDEIKVENGVVKAVKRVGSVDLGTLTWTKSSSHNYFFTDNIVDFLKPANDNSIANIICAKYQTLDAVSTVSDLIFPNIAAGASALRRVFINEPSFNDASSLQSALNGVMLYYELATPQEYILDSVQYPFIYKWFGIDANNNEVLAETLPWYVSGQDTNKLKVDAMWGEKINVVLRAMMPTGLLSPSKAYASLSWRIPDVDATVVSYNGSAVRSDTESMTFGTIVNVKGRSLEDSVKAANLRFKWIYRKNTTTQETVAGWSQGESDQITIQASNLRNTRPQNSSLASTLVFPYVYCLGAWTTDSGTETGYSKPTTTKNGVTYYRIID